MIALLWLTLEAATARANKGTVHLTAVVQEKGNKGDEVPTQATGHG
jgi:hypothetical protein